MVFPPNFPFMLKTKKKFNFAQTCFRAIARPPKV